MLLGDVSAAAVVVSLQAAGFALRVPEFDDFATITRVFPFVYKTTRMPVDVVIGGPGLEDLFLQASERLVVGGVSVPVPRVEHLVVMKLLAGRPHDLMDSAAMARANDVDFDAIEQLAKVIADELGEHDILAALAQLRRTLTKR